MLRQAHNDLRQDYYDPTFHGVDIDKLYTQFDERLNTSHSVNETYRVIAAYTLSLKDSHTSFSPPPRQNSSTLGYQIQVVGDKCLVTHIRPGTDAATKLHPGDQVLTIHNFKINPSNYRDIEYFFQGLSPAPAEALDILTPAGEQRHVEINAILRKGKPILDLTDSDNNADELKLMRDEEEDDDLSRGRYVEDGDTMIWKMPSFEVDPNDLDKVFAKAAKHKNLIIDLRGNPGGYIATLKEALGHFFDHPVTLGTLVTRKDTRPEIIKPVGPLYNGNVIVLVDRNSASCSELFAKVIQLEHRGIIVGDHSAGAVMEAKYYPESLGTDYKLPFGFSITFANILMTDGKSLENVGVTPDQLLIPRPTDLAEDRDPVLANVASQFGLQLTPEAAARLFPYQWPPL
jgi:C-terminal processing protease CtpA/Prc